MKTLQMRDLIDERLRKGAKTRAHHCTKALSEILRNVQISTKTKDTLTTKSIHEREDIQILAQRTKKSKAEFKKPLAKKPKVEGFAKPRIHYKTLRLKQRITTLAAAITVAYLSSISIVQWDERQDVGKGYRTALSPSTATFPLRLQTDGLRLNGRREKDWHGVMWRGLRIVAGVSKFPPLHYAKQPQSHLAARWFTAEVLVKERGWKGGCITFVVIWFELSTKIMINCLPDIFSSVLFSL
jgi:hypothetical protein